MALEPNAKLTAVVTSLWGAFSPLFDEWRKSHPNDVPASAHACLNEDIIALGKAIAKLDARGSRVETRVIAEALFHVQAQKSTMPYEYVLENLDRTVTAAPSPEGVPALHSAKVVSEWVAGSPERKAAGKEVLARLMDLINFFVLYDGNVSGPELQFFGQIEKQFAF